MARDATDPGRARPPVTVPPAPSGFPSSSFGSTVAPDSEFESGLAGAAAGLASAGAPRWLGWRLRLLVGCALLGCVALFLLAHRLAGQAQIDADWRATPSGQLELAATREPLLQPHVGQVLSGLLGGTDGVATPTALALQPAARWVVDDAVRKRLVGMQAQVHAALAHEQVRLYFRDAGSVTLSPQPLGMASLPAMFWMLSAFALVLYLVAMVVLLARPALRNLLYAVMSLGQSGNLVFMAVESTLHFGLPGNTAMLDMPMRSALDLGTAAAVVCAAAVHPRRLPGAPAIALLAVLVAAAIALLSAAGALARPWWWVQGGTIALGLLAIGLMDWSYRIEPHPFAMVLRRFGVAAVGGWALLTLLVATAETPAGQAPGLTFIGPLLWSVCLASALLLLPFLSRSQQVMREFALLAAISTVATALDLLFVTVFSLGQFASLTLSLFISLAVYTGARQWILNQLMGNSMLTTERMFEQLYRIAREVEAYPERTAALLSQLLRELFEPMEVTVVDKRSSLTRITGDGSTMLVPVPLLSGADSPASSVAVRFARRGRRLFTSEDARLTDRIVEQLCRAVAFDKAVEQGRSEERLRLAQDLHDDIGARLLTLMYKAQTPEMEEYLRHTLKDLKTLTRGLAAAHHRVSHATAEWKADLTQRLTAAHVELGWHCEFDDDVMLSVVQWSALTRVLRELVSNVIAHAQARRVDIEFALQGDRLDLLVSDDGLGRNPRAWSHGLGLGGVRKRVKQLGGEVEWREVQPRGILCRVTIRALSMRP